MKHFRWANELVTIVFIPRKMSLRALETKHEKLLLAAKQKKKEKEDFEQAAQQKKREEEDLEKEARNIKQQISQKYREQTSSSSVNCCNYLLKIGR